MLSELVVVLHNVRSAHNVGSIFRTADTFGCTKVYLCGITPAPLDRFGRENTRLTKVSLGAEHAVAWEQQETAHACIVLLKAKGYQVYALEQDPRAVPYREVKAPTSSTALIVGDEVHGISQDILNLVDGIMEIPHHGIKESLNVGVAFGIAVSHLRHTAS